MAQEYKVEDDVVYAQNSKTDLTLKIYKPESSTVSPAVLVLHPGGWDKKSADMSAVCKKLAKAGFVVFNLNYSLAPEFRYPQPIEDVRAGLKWVRENAAKYKVNAEKIFLWGYSAGGHLALMVGLDPQNHVQGIVAGGTPTDFPAYPKSPIITKFIGKTFEEAKQVWQEASPIRQVATGSPPVFLYHGEWDQLVGIDQMEKMTEKLKSLKVEVQTHRVSFLGHAAVYLLSAESERLGVEFISNLSQ